MGSCLRAVVSPQAPWARSTQHSTSAVHAGPRLQLHSLPAHAARPQQLVTVVRAVEEYVINRCLASKQVRDHVRAKQFLSQFPGAIAQCSPVTAGCSARRCILAALGRSGLASRDPQLAFRPPACRGGPANPPHIHHRMPNVGPSCLRVQTHSPPGAPALLCVTARDLVRARCSAQVGQVARRAGAKGGVRT